MQWLTIVILQCTNGKVLLPAIQYLILKHHEIASILFWSTKYIQINPKIHPNQPQNSMTIVTELSPNIHEN